jgi:hypothetical protein
MSPQRPDHERIVREPRALKPPDGWVSLDADVEGARAFCVGLHADHRALQDAARNAAEAVAGAERADRERRSAAVAAGKPDPGRNAAATRRNHHRHGRRRVGHRAARQGLPRHTPPVARDVRREGRGMSAQRFTTRGVDLTMLRPVRFLWRPWLIRGTPQPLGRRRGRRQVNVASLVGRGVDAGQIGRGVRRSQGTRSLRGRR